MSNFSVNGIQICYSRHNWIALLRFRSYERTKKAYPVTGYASTQCNQIGYSLTPSECIT